MTRRSIPLMLGALVAAVLVVYTPVWEFDFIRGDDGTYVNDRVLEGLSFANLAWSFTTFQSSNWHPLTWWSLMLDAEIGGGGPAMFHATNLALHLLNCLLLYAVLSAMTGERGRSLVVALLFAVHPLHVESVAWVSERKDVLSTVFGLLVMLAYLRGSRLWTAALFALGLMAKPMLVTLPLVLMLLDWWPLGRWRDARSVILDKLPLLVLAAASCAITLVAQSAGGAVATLERFPLLVRAANALASYARYVGKTFWPADLAPQYPYDLSPSPWLVAGGALMLAGVCWSAFRLRRSRPYLLVGWLWFVGTLVPVIGLVQVGHQAMADRYTYIPSIGLFVIVAWGVPDLLGRRRALTAAAAALAVVALAGAARIQAGHWRDSLSLFTHAVRTTPGNVMAHVNLGAELQQAGRVDEAIEQYRLALKADPGSEGARANLAAGLTHRGLLRLREERYTEAESEFLAALEIDPTLAPAWKSLGVAVFRQGRLDEAIAHFTESLRLDPGQEKVREDLENLRRLAGRH